MIQVATHSKVPLSELIPEFNGSTTVADITTHSGSVIAGGLFLAVKGYGNHGLAFLNEALTRCPAAVVWEPAEDISPPMLPATIAGLPVPDLGQRVGAIADRFFDAPSAQLRVSGVTGTNGKTTTAWLLAQALDHLGLRTGYMGTLGYGIGPVLEPTALTTPGCITVHRRLRAMADAGAAAVCMEVSSHGLDQGRIDGVRVRTAAFTNLSRDHLDYHTSLTAYKKAKARLFRHAGLESAVINIGDEFGRELVTLCKGQMPVLAVATYTGAEEYDETVLTAELLAAAPAGLHVRFTRAGEVCQLQSPLWGGFNVENLMVAAGMICAHGYSLQAAVTALGICTAPPGRMQCIGEGMEGPVVVVDFAHTPAALQQALVAMRAHCSGQLWVVFGCGGDRDSGKRGQMGAIAARFADQIILTSDNPRSENPGAIINAILAGMEGAADVKVISDRAAAIRAAIDLADVSDAVLIAGKGSETGQQTGQRIDPFSDAAVAAAALGVAA